MDESVSAADANRMFSTILRGVREDGTSYIVTSHGKPVARIVPIAAGAGATSEAARKALLARLVSEPLVDIGPWSRDELYEPA